MKYLKKFNDSIRISCAGLASIKINDKYLLIRNKSSYKNGYVIYGPLGGALEYKPEALDFLNSIECQFERTTPDLRFVIDTDHLKEFDNWYYTTNDREKSCIREVIEELQDEEKLISNLSENDIQEVFVETVKNKASRFDVVSQRYFDIFKVTFSPEIERKIIEIESQPESPIKLLNKEEILNTEEIVTDGYGIGFHSRFILI